MKVYKKYYQVTNNDKVTIRELTSDLPFSVEEGKVWILNKHPKAKIKHISYKEVQQIEKLRLDILNDMRELRRKAANS